MATPAVDPWASVLGAAGVPVPGVVRPVVPRAGATDLATWGSEREFLLGEGALSREVIADRRITLARCLPLEVTRDEIDRRLLAALEYLAASGLDPRVLGANCDPVARSSGSTSPRSTACRSPSGPEGASIGAVTLERLRGPPARIRSERDRERPRGGRLRARRQRGGHATGSSSRFASPLASSPAGSRPLASAASAITAPSVSLHAADWTLLSARLNLLGNPGLLHNPALALPARDRPRGRSVR